MLSDGNRQYSYDAMNRQGKHEAEIMANYDMLFDVEGPEAALKYLQDNGVNIQVDSYYNMTHGEGKVQGQAHHLSQDAAYATSRAIQQQSDKKVGVYVPRLPGKINQKK